LKGRDAPKIEPEDGAADADAADDAADADAADAEENRAEVDADAKNAAAEDGRQPLRGCVCSFFPLLHPRSGAVERRFDVAAAGCRGRRGRRQERGARG